MGLAKCSDTSSNSLTIYQSSSPAVILKKLDEIKVSGEIITIETNHLQCIKEFQSALSSMAVKTNEGYEIERPIKLIELLFIDIFEWFGRDVQISHIQGLAKTIYKNYYWLRLSELKLFIERMKSGYYGKEFHKLSPAIIMERLTAFANESMELRAKITNDEHDKIVYQEKEDRTAQQTRDAISFHQAQLEHFKNNIEKQDS